MFAHRETALRSSFARAVQRVTSFHQSETSCLAEIDGTFWLSFAINQACSRRRFGPSQPSPSAPINCSPVEWDNLPSIWHYQRRSGVVLCWVDGFGCREQVPETCIAADAAKWWRRWKKRGKKRKRMKKRRREKRKKKRNRRGRKEERRRKTKKKKEEGVEEEEKDEEQRKEEREGGEGWGGRCKARYVERR